MSKRIIMAKVGLSGVAATGVDVLSLVLLIEFGGVFVTVAAFFGAMFGGVTNFLINKFWAFRDPAPIDVRQVTTYVVVSLATACFVALSVHVFAVLMGLPYLLAKALAAAIVFLLWTYPAQSKLVFPAERRVRPQAS